MSTSCSGDCHCFNGPGLWRSCHFNCFPCPVTFCPHFSPSALTGHLSEMSVKLVNVNSLFPFNSHQSNHSSCNSYHGRCGRFYSHFNFHVDTSMSFVHKLSFIILLVLIFNQAASHPHNSYQLPPHGPVYPVMHRHHRANGRPVMFIPGPPRARPNMFYRSSHVHAKHPLPPPPVQTQQPVKGPLLPPPGPFGPRDHNAFHVKGHPFHPNSSTPWMYPSPQANTLPMVPQVIKFPGTCKLQRSPLACSFSFLCQQTGGRLIEPCEGNIGLTCCVLPQPKSPSALPPKAFSSPVPLNGPEGNNHHFTHPSGHDRLRSLSNKQASKLKHTRHPSQLLHPPYVMAPSVPEISAIVHPIHRPPNSPSDNVITLPFSWPISSSNFIRDLEPLPPGKHLEKYPKLKPGSSAASVSFSKATSVSNDSSTSPVTESTISTDDFFRSIFGENSTDKVNALDSVSEEEICGRRVVKATSRIVGGQNARFGEFPWQVHIRIGKQHCSGALLNRFYVLTAAHCVHQASLSNLAIVIGATDLVEHNSQEPPQYFSVEKITTHPKFIVSAINPDRFDVALLKLGKAVKYAPNVLPICLPPSLPPTLTLGGSVGTVTGWGATNPIVANVSTRLLQKVDVPIINDEECKSWHKTKGIFLQVYPEMFCAGYESGSKDACTGDSGGPFVINLNERWTVVGITSAGFGCAEAFKPGIYHKVTVSVDWIKQNIES